MFVVQYMFVVVLWLEGLLPVHFYVLKVFRYALGYIISLGEISSSRFSVFDVDT